jgi:SAM-dependent methyltransferase
MRLLPQGGSVLDIGCGNGGFLRSLARLGDYKLHGIELPGPAADRAATVPGIHLQRRPIAPGDYPSGSFDLITLFHVIEHLPAPADLFSQASTLLKPGGHLLLSLPNCGSWQARLCGQHWLHWDPPRHLWLAPPSALVAAGSRVGLLPERMSHLSLEQNPFGLLQGLLNHAFPRDRLYEWLKRSDPKRGKGTPPVLDLAFAILLGPACVVFSLAESVAGKGGTFELCLRKDADPTSADRGSA